MAIDFKKLVKGLFIKDSSDPSKGFKLEIDPTAATNTTTTILAEQQTNVTLSLPGETSELVGDVANQTLQNKTIDASNNTIVGLTDAEISVNAAIDVTKLADGSVDNTEFQYLNGASSNIQTQLTTNATAINNHITDTTDAHDASAIRVVGFADTDAQALFQTLDTYKLTVGSSQQLVSDLNANSNKITALATPVSGTDAANKNYVDGIAAGLDPKESVRVASTVDIGGSYATTPSNGRFTGAATTIDGVALSTNDRVLIKDQADAKQNGIYVYDGAGQYTRSADMDGSPSSEVSGGNFVFVAQGTTNGASGYVLVASGIVTLNTDNLNFTQFSGGANSANKNLSNLDAPTSINQDLLPSSNNSKSIGSSSLNYQNAYITTLKDNAGVDSHAVSSRILKDSAGSNSIDYSNTSEVSLNSKKLNSLGSAAGLNYATTKQNVQDYIKNLIPDGDAEGANIISVYNDSSTTRPLDGSGGVQANLAATITSTNPLSGTNSFLLTKSGSASTQGSGFSIPFTIGSAYKAKVLQIEFDYIVNSGTFVAGSSTSESDVIVYIYDVTNSQLIEPSSIKFLSNSSTISDKFIANFQTSATGTSYRLILHCQSTSTANYELKLDNIAIKPCNYVYGTPVTDWQSYTPTGSWITNTTYTGKWRRVGDTMEIQNLVTTSGAPTATTLTVTIPSGYTIDTSKILATDPDLALFGWGQTLDAGTAAYPMSEIGYSTPTSVRVGIINASGTYGANNVITNTVPFTYGAGDQVSLNYRVPITGWSSSVQQSDGYDGRQIAALVNRVTSSQTISGASDVKIQWNNKVNDLTASFDSTTNYRFTVPSSGIYKFSGNIGISAAASSTNVYAYLYKNNSPVRTLGTAISSTTLTYSIPLNGQDSAVAGDYYEIFVNPNSVSMNVLSSASINGGSHLSIEKLQSPQTMSATERVSARYENSVAQSIPASSVTNNTVVDFATKKWDTHNAVSGTGSGVGGSWKFTAPVAGEYEISLSVRSTTGSWSIGSEWSALIFKNGAYNNQAYYMAAQNTASYSIAAIGTQSIELNAGEYISVGVYQNSGGARNTDNNPATNWIEIKRVK